MTTTPDFSLDQQSFQLVRETVYKHCGISLSEEKIMLVRARIAKEMRKGNFQSVSAYLDHVLADKHSAAFTGFIDSISTNLTSFFRESQHFDFLTQQVLPSLLMQKRARGQMRLLGWSAACSSGEEPYSLAMTLLDALEHFDTTFRCDIRLLATDISTHVLAIARKGLYSPARVASIPHAFRTKYLYESGTNYEVSPDLRRVIRFRHLNLMDAWPFQGPLDFIFCRNVMIYFDKPTQQKLVERFWNLLPPGGLLFTGHSESLTGIVTRFEHLKPSIYRKPVS